MAWRIRAEMYPNVIPREDIWAAIWFAFSVSWTMSRVVGEGKRGVDSVEEDAREDSGRGCTGVISG